MSDKLLVCRGVASARPGICAGPFSNSRFTNSSVGSDNDKLKFIGL
jgi:hypothetical protein